MKGVLFRSAVVLLWGAAAIGCGAASPGGPTAPGAPTGGAPTGAGGGAGGGPAGTSGSGGTGGTTRSSGGATGGAGGAGARAGNGAGGTTLGGAGAGAVSGLGACLLPVAARFADAQAAYARFKTDLLTPDGAGGFLRVRRPNSPGAVDTTNSEGIGYGMLIAVYMNDQNVFDQLWRYEQLHLDGNGLMNWEINPQGTGTTAGGGGAATDGDEDMAFALAQADRTWGGRGALTDSYLNLARRQVGLIWQFEIDHTRGDVLTPGDQFGGGQVINISYFAPAYYRVFGTVTGQTAQWTRVMEASYRALAAALSVANQNASNGLVPAWSTPDGTPMPPGGAGYPTYHQLDSSRTPFRIAEDYCWFNEPRALSYLRKISGFYAGVGAANILDAYNLDGTPAAGASLHLAAFVGPAGVGAMADGAYATLRDQAYAALITPPGLLGGSLYYNESWTVLSLIMMTGRLTP